MNKRNDKLAFCFLTYTNLSQPKLWNIFFRNSSEYNIYIHNKFNLSDTTFNKYRIRKPIPTKYGHISLVKATLLLFKTAFDADKNNEYFILLSDKCIPLYDFNTIYKKIIKQNSSIISCFTGNIDRYDNLKNMSFFDRDKFMKQDQWMILKRNDVDFFINNDYTNIFGNNIFAADEHYFVNICNKFNINYIKDFITYVNKYEKSDNDIYRPEPKTYSKLKNSVIDKIKRIYPNILFMRKIARECAIPTKHINNITT